MVILALSLIVSTRSFMPGSFIVSVRPSTRFVASLFEVEWCRNAPFSTIKFLEKVLQYGKMFFYSYRYTTNILTPETATGYPLVPSPWVWKLELVFFSFYFQSPAPGSEFGRFFYSTIKIFHRKWIYTNCHWKTAYCIVFKTSHHLLCVPLYSIRYLLRK